MNERPFPLTDLATSEEAVIVAVSGPEASRLSDFGLYPGIRVTVRQRFPSLVIKSEETELALESGVASRILVTRA